jgi:hypothetical protein
MARRDHTEIPVEHDEGLPHGVDDCVGEGMPILDMAQHVVGHGEVFSKSRRCPTAAFPFGGKEKSSGRAEGVRIPETN